MGRSFFWAASGVVKLEEVLMQTKELEAYNLKLLLGKLRNHNVASSRISTRLDAA